MQILKNMKVLVLLILFNILCSVCTSGTIDPYVDDSEYLKYGEHFQYVGRLEGSYKDGSLFRASAVAIDEHHILTAAHILDNAIYNSCVFVLRDKQFNIPRFVKPKEFNMSNHGTYDIALGFSKESFNLKFYPELYTDNDENGKLCCIAGYGTTGNFLIGSQKLDGNLRAGSNLIDTIHRHLLICSPSPLGSSERTSLEFLISKGDSGGGLFIGGKLAGINSCVLSDSGGIPNSSYDDQSGHTRISRFADWINKNRTKQTLDETSYHHYK